MKISTKTDLTKSRGSLLSATVATILMGASLLAAPAANAACVAGQTTDPNTTVSECAGSAHAVPDGTNESVEGTLNDKAEGNIVDRAMNAFTPNASASSDTELKTGDRASATPMKSNDEGKGSSDSTGVN